MVTLKQIVAGTSIIATLAGGMYLNGRGTLNERKNLIYQGYHTNKTENFDVLIFDNEPYSNRTADPELRVIGKPDGLKIGEKYDVRVKSPKWFGLDKVDSIERSD